MVGAVSTDELAADVSAHYATLDHWIKGNSDFISPLLSSDMGNNMTVEAFETLLVAVGWQWPDT
ncbi:hypothetical protein [Vreelandella venusta]|uniref:hypothetical protein n=1 Tax=Vreelandella venusta TaxID=44935 RepID=UPI0015539FCD|nr:hypothetical protein [Halomonas hydrothermalis]